MLGSHAVVDANSHLLKVRAMPPTVKVIGVVIGGRAFERQMKTGLPLVRWTNPAYPLSIGGSAISTQRFTPEFKEEAVKQVIERGYSVPDVAARLGVSAHSLYKWVKAVAPDKSEHSPRNCWKPRARFFGYARKCVESKRSVTC